MAGAVTGGGLTVIANSPNPAGQSILASRFGEAGIFPLYLFLGALVPTLIDGAVFMLFSWFYQDDRFCVSGVRLTLTNSE
jgi:hypothetical protein